jgi:hypothetical protein
MLIWYKKPYISHIHICKSLKMQRDQKEKPSFEGLGPKILSLEGQLPRVAGFLKKGTSPVSAKYFC